MLLTVSPFYHYNAANYDSSPTTFPSPPRRIAPPPTPAARSASAPNLPGIIFRRASTVFTSRITSCSARSSTMAAATALHRHRTPHRQPRRIFRRRQIQVIPWLTYGRNAAYTFFRRDGFSENAISPRFGAALTVPHLNWTFRGFYGHYYQAPPLITASGPAAAISHAKRLRIHLRCTASATRNISSE